MKILWKYLFKYNLLFFTRVLTISLAALSVICFDFMMGFIVDIFSNGETEKFVPIILASIFLIILLLSFVIYHLKFCVTNPKNCRFQET